MTKPVAGIGIMECFAPHAFQSAHPVSGPTAAGFRSTDA